jgi:hypothetical protein
MNLKFKTWIETFEIEKNVIKSTILSFLKEKTGITSDDELLGMQLNSIDKKIISDLFLMGIIQNASEDVVQDVKNSSITILELIEKLSKN